VTGKEVLVEDRNKVFKLPDLAEFMRDTGGTGKSDRNREADRKEISGELLDGWMDVCMDGSEEEE